MRRAFLASVALGLAASPVAAQVVADSSNDLENVVAHNLDKELAKRFPSPADRTAASAAARAAWTRDFVGKTIPQMIQAFDWLKGVALGGEPVFRGGNGDYGGAGSQTGGWEAYNPCDWEPRFEGFFLVIPTMPITGTQMLEKVKVPWHYTTTNAKNHSQYQYAKKDHGAALRKIHLENMSRPKGIAWSGVVAVNTEVGNGATGWATASVGEWNWGLYTWKDRYIGFFNTQPVNEPSYTGPEYEFRDCPADQAGSVGFDFYAHGPSLFNGAQCTWYRKDYALSRNGYAYGDYASIPIVDFLAENGKYQPWLAECNISPWFLALLTNWLVQEGCDATGEPCDPVTPEDIDGDTPLPEAADPVGELPDTPQTPAPPPDPTPDDPGTDDGGGDGGGSNDGEYDNPGWTEPDVTVPELTFWMPQLPSLNLDFDPTCPTYQFDFFGEPMIFEQHCPLIEDNRQTIALLMVAFFSIASVMVILRA